MHTDDVSPAWCVRLLAEFHAADARAVALAGPLTLAQLNWSPRPGAWSIGQCLEHLAVTNDMYLPALAQAVQGCRSGASDEIRPGWFGRWFIRNVGDAPAIRKQRAPRKIKPVAQVDARILDRFLAGNAEARRVVESAQRCDVNRVRFVNPFVRLVRFTVGTGFEILSRHQRRHLLQAKRVRENAGFAEGDSGP